MLCIEMYSISSNDLPTKLVNIPIIFKSNRPIYAFKMIRAYLFPLPGQSKHIGGHTGSGAVLFLIAFQIGRAIVIAAVF